MTDQTAIRASILAALPSSAPTVPMIGFWKLGEAKALRDMPIIDVRCALNALVSDKLVRMVGTPGRGESYCRTPLGDQEAGKGRASHGR